MAHSPPMHPNTMDSDGLLPCCVSECVCVEQYNHTFCSINSFTNRSRTRPASSFTLESMYSCAFSCISCAAAAQL